MIDIYNDCFMHMYERVVFTTPNWMISIKNQYKELKRLGTTNTRRKIRIDTNKNPVGCRTTIVSKTKQKNYVYFYATTY